MRGGEVPRCHPRALDARDADFNIACRTQRCGRTVGATRDDHSAAPADNLECLRVEMSFILGHYVGSHRMHATAAMAWPVRRKGTFDAAVWVCVHKHIGQA